MILKQVLEMLKEQLPKHIKSTVMSIYVTSLSELKKIIRHNA